MESVDDPLSQERESLEIAVGTDPGRIVCGFLSDYYHDILYERLDHVPFVFLLKFALDKRFFKMVENVWFTCFSDDERAGNLGKAAMVHCAHEGNFLAVRWLLIHGASWDPRVFRIFQMKDDFLALHWFSINGYVPRTGSSPPTTMNYQIPSWRKKRKR